jgi:hypothetical protein
LNFPPYNAPPERTHLLFRVRGNDLVFKVTLRSALFALVDDKLPQTKVACILICFGDDPGRGVGDAEGDDLASADHIVERVHELGDRDGELLP